MSDNTLQPVTGASTAPVTVTPEPSAHKVHMINGEGLTIHVVQNDKITAFVGAVDNVVLPKVIRALDGSRERMLVDAINNRTRERNYYRLYSQLLEDEISEEEFDREIDENPDEYVVSADKIPTEQEFHDAIVLADHIKDIETTGDIETLFSFSGKEFNEYCKKLLNGSL